MFVFVFRFVLVQVHALHIETSAELAEEVRVALVPAEQLYAAITAQADVQYTGGL